MLDLFKNLPVWPQDKANHFVYGSIAYLIIAGGQHLLLGHASPASAMMAVIAIGLVKEVSDYLVNMASKTAVHGVELLDAVATSTGGLVCFLASSI